MATRDFRSDTVTKPSAAMLQAMTTCEVGDDVMEDDPTVKTLETRVAEMFEREGALFFPSCTMANLAAIMCWCDGRGSEMIVGDNCHIYLYEQGNSAYLAGVSSRSIKTEPDGTLDVDSIVSSVRSDDVHFPRTRLICLEQTHNMCGGRVLPDGYILNVARVVKAQYEEVKVHVDGARIWNAASYLNQSVAAVAKGADSISVCFSKGLGAPAGAMLIGPSHFIAQARRTRKALGGGMRQVGILAAACLVGLDDFLNGSLNVDHSKTLQFAQSVVHIKGFTVDIDAVQTNMCVVHIDKAVLSSNPFFNVNFVVEHIGREGIKISARDKSSLRIVMHRDITDSCVSSLIQSLEKVSAQLF